MSISNEEVSNIVSKIIEDISLLKSKGVASSMPQRNIYDLIIKKKPFDKVLSVLKRKENSSRNIEFKFLLNGLLNYKGLTQKSVYTNSNLSKSYFSELLKGDKHPSRESTICLCFGFKLNIDETNLLLKNAGYNELYLHDIKDVIIAHSLTNKLSIIETNIKLEENNLPILGKK